MSKGCYSCMRVTLVVMNVLFLLIGLALLGFAVFLYIDDTVITTLGSFGMSLQINIILFVAMGVGAVTVVISAFGCCGAYHQSPCQLTVYLICLVVIAAIEVGGAVYLYMNWQEGIVRDSMTKSISASIVNGTVPVYIQEMQRTLRCCGANGSSDFDPATASKLCRNENGTMHNEGCVDKAIQVAQAYSLWIFIAIVSIAVLELIGMLLSVYLCCQAREYVVSQQYVGVNTNT